MAYIIQTRHDLAANWTSVDPILAEGEAGYELDTGKLKYGDGTTAWTSLPYFSGAAAGVSSLNSLTGALDITSPNSTIDITPNVTDVEIDLPVSGVVAGTYGDATNVAQITVDAYGIVTSAVDVPISAGTGDVVGPASATDGAFALFDGTTGKLIKNSSAPGTGIMTFLATPSSANLRSAMTDESGTGVLLFQDGDLGTPSAGVATNLTGTAAGLTAGNATAAATVASANEATDTTCFPLFITASGTQTLETKNNTNLTFNSNTANLGCTTFTGALVGNASTATALATGRTIGGVTFDGTANIVPDTITSVNEGTDTTCFPLFITASGTQSLQPKNNTALTFNSNTGVLGATTFSGAGTSLTGTAASLTAGIASTVSTSNEASDTTCFIAFFTASGTQTLEPKNSTSLTYNASTSNLGATTFTGALVGNADTATKAGIPQNSQSTAYTTVASDANSHILHPTADNNARTFTIAANASVAYAIGTTITFVNQINTVTIAINSDTLTLAGTGGTGSRTLAANGMATALKIASTSWIISGTGANLSVQQVLLAYGAAAALLTSVEQGAVTIAAGATSGTLTISSVDTTLAHIGGFITASTASNATINPRVELTNATTVTAYRNTQDASNAVTVRVAVVVWKSANISNIQQGTITLTAASSNTATITSVTTTDSAVFFLGNTTSYGSTGYGNVPVSTVLTDATTVTGQRGNTNANCTVGYVVVSFASGTLNSNTQAISIAVTSTNLSNTASPSSVTTSLTMLAWGGLQSTSANINFAKIGSGVLTNGTTITATRDSTANDFTFKCTVVEFKTADVNLIQRGTATVTGGNTTQNTTVTSVDTANSFVSFLGFRVSTTQGTETEAYVHQYLSSATNILTTRNTSDASITSSGSYELIELK